jgi:hypothetical protein
MMANVKSDAPLAVRCREQEDVISEIGHWSTDTLIEISILCDLVLDHLQQPGNTSDAETAARVLEIITCKASEMANLIDTHAGAVGVALTSSRSARRRAARQSMPHIVQGVDHADR